MSNIYVDTEKTYRDMLHNYVKRIDDKYVENLDNDNEKREFFYRKGIESNLYSRFKEAISYFRLAAGLNKNNNDAISEINNDDEYEIESAKIQHGLANSYDNLKLYDRAFKLDTIAAEKGFSNAQFRLGQCYEIGYGIIFDLTEMEGGGLTYEHKIEGVEMDSEKAYIWYKAAAEQNHKQAIIAVKSMRNNYPDITYELDNAIVLK